MLYKIFQNLAFSEALRCDLRRLFFEMHDQVLTDIRSSNLEALRCLKIDFNSIVWHNICYKQVPGHKFHTALKKSPHRYDYMSESVPNIAVAIVLTAFGANILREKHESPVCDSLLQQQLEIVSILWRPG